MKCTCIVESTGQKCKLPAMKGLDVCHKHKEKCEEKYLKLSSNKPTFLQDKRNNLKSLAFFITDGTIGDQKPLAILAVYAAQAASRLLRSPPVIIACEVVSAKIWLQSIERFAEWFIGPEYKKWIAFDYNFEDSTEYEKKLKKTHMVFECSPCVDDDDRDREILLDFGDNEGSKNRFTSRLLANYRPKSNYFGSVFLPLQKDHVYWSSPEAIRELQSFLITVPSRKILTVTNSQTAPFSMNEILEWLEKNEMVNTEWAFVIVGYKIKQLETVRKYHTQLLCMREFIEYEDLVTISDFFVSNCGAESTIAPIAAGCPQLCRTRGARGDDKISNAEVVFKMLRMGPQNMTFENLMDDLKINYETYAKNAILAKNIIDEETKQFVSNMSFLFTDILTEPSLQAQIERTNQLPPEYGLATW